MTAAAHCVTGRARLSYCNLTTPQSRNGQDPKYSVTILVPKSDTTTKTKIDAAIEAAKQHGASKTWQGMPAIVNTPVHDGDGTRPSNGEAFDAECKGHWVVTASSKNKPHVVDGNLNEILDATQIYSGMYARVSVDFFPYAAQGRKGVGCGLQNVQKLDDGEPLGARTRPEDDFTPVSGATAYAQPAAAHAYSYAAPAYDAAAANPFARQ